MVFPPFITHQEGVCAGNIEEQQPAPQVFVIEVLDSLAVMGRVAADHQQPLFPESFGARYEYKCQHVTVLAGLNIKGCGHCFEELQFLAGCPGAEGDEIHQLNQHIYLLLLLQFLVYLLTDGQYPHCSKRSPFPVTDAVFR